MKPLFKDFKTKDWVWFIMIVGGGLITLGTMISTAEAERKANSNHVRETRKLLDERTQNLAEQIKENKIEIKENRKILYEILKKVK